MTFNIAKVCVMEGCSSLVAKGEQYTGRELRLWQWDTEDNKTVKSCKDIEAGWQLVLTDPDGTYLRTSKIQEILKQEDDEVVCRTETSIYRIREV